MHHRNRAAYGNNGFFTKTLLAVLVIFYVLGCIVKLVLDKNFKEMDEPEKEQEESRGRTGTVRFRRGEQE